MFPRNYSRNARTRSGFSFIEEDADRKDNLGKCPNRSLRKNLHQFRVVGLWDEEEVARSRHDNKVKFTPAIKELAA